MRTQVAEASCIIAIVERRPQHIRRNTWRSRLYIDDVQEIVDVLGAEGSEVEISVPGYSTKGGADQLLQFTGKTLHEIEIRRPRPVYVLVDLQPGRGSVWGAEDDATTVGLVNKTADVLRRCRRWPSIIVFNVMGLPRFDGQGWWLGQATCLMTSWWVVVSNSLGVR